MAASALLDKQFTFCQMIARLILFIPEQAQMEGDVWNVKFGEGYVGETDKKDGDHDGPHMEGGTHYMSIGQDLLLFDGNGGLLPGNHRAYRIAGSYWKSLHPLARWGGDFSSPDPDHFSFEHNGRR